MNKKYITIKKFTPTKVELSDGTILIPPKGSTYDYDILKKIFEDTPIEQQEPKSKVFKYEEDIESEI